MVIEFSPNGKNRTPDVVKSLLHATDNTVLRFEAGDYDFYADGAYSGYFFPCCNRNGEKQVVFPFLNLENIVIEGNGAKFLFHDRVFPFIIQNCKNVVLKNFSIDFTFPRCLEAVVSSMDDDGFSLKIINGEHCVNEYGNLLIKAGSEMFSSSERRYFLEQRDWHCFISVGDIYYQNINSPADVVYCSAECRKDEVYFRYKPKTEKVKFALNKKLILSYDELRENDVFFLERSKDTVIKDIHILHGAGMGVVGQCCENLHLDRYVVDPLDDGLYSTTADAILLTNFSGKVIIENSRVDRSIDDAISIHGFYTKIENITDRKKAVAKLIHPSQAGTNIYFKGDVLTASDGQSMTEKGKVTVKKAYIRDLPELIMLEFEEDIVDLLKIGDILENAGRTPEIEIRNSVFINFPAIRLSSAKKTVFENNIVKNCNGILINDLMKYWYVSGCVNNLKIINNEFENIGVAINVFVDREKKSKSRHRNISIIGNRFINCNKAIKAELVDNITIKDNYFENVPEPLTLEDCTDVICQKV